MLNVTYRSSNQRHCGMIHNVLQQLSKKITSERSLSINLFIMLIHNVLAEQEDHIRKVLLQKFVFTYGFPDIWSCYILSWGGPEGQLTRTHNPCKKGTWSASEKVKSLNLYNNVILKKPIFPIYLALNFDNLLLNSMNETLDMFYMFSFTMRIVTLAYSVPV